LRYRPGRNAALSRRATCLYPSCSKLVDYRSSQGGRPALFCGPNCRANFYNIQRQLEARERELVAMLHDAEAADSAATDLDLVRWHLLRFQTRT